MTPENLTAEERDLVRQADEWVEQHPQAPLTVKDLDAITDGLTDAIMRAVTARYEARIVALESQLATKGAGLAARLKNGDPQR